MQLCRWILNSDDRQVIDRLQRVMFGWGSSSNADYVGTLALYLPLQGYSHLLRLEDLSLSGQFQVDFVDLSGPSWLQVRHFNVRIATSGGAPRRGWIPQP